MSFQILNTSFPNEVLHVGIFWPNSDYSPIRTRNKTYEISRQGKNNFCFLPNKAIKFWVPLDWISTTIFTWYFYQDWKLLYVYFCFTLPILLETLVSTMCWGWKEIIIPLFSSLASNNGFICSVNLSLFNDIWVLGFHGFDTKLNVISRIILSQSHTLEQ